jgi:hypothetical protein
MGEFLGTSTSAPLIACTNAMDVYEAPRQSKDCLLFLTL